MRSRLVALLGVMAMVTCQRQPANAGAGTTSDRHATVSTPDTYDEITTIEWLTAFNVQVQFHWNIKEIAEWNYLTNMTDENSRKYQQVTLDFNKWYVKKKLEAMQIDGRRLSFDTAWMLHFVTRGPVIDDGDAAREITSIKGELETLYGTTKVCLKKNVCLGVEPNLTDIMQNSRNYDELLDVWLRWRDAVGPQMRRSYARLVSLLNHVARSSGYSDQAEVWKELFDIPDLRSYVEQKWQRLRPLYLQLHAYARSKLRHLYGKNKVSEKGPIPAHILGNMWAQDWSSLYSLLAPYPGVELPDISSELQGQEYTADRIFHTAEDFYTSIGLEPMTKTFWKRSMLQKPAGRDVMCHGSAFNMHDWRGEDFRIKMCTEIDSSHFSTAHHEMGHIEYYMMYGDQPDLYQEGANPAFHEAVGDTILLSVSTPQHQSIIGLAAPSSHADNYEFQINYLMKMALRTVAFLPFGLLVDLWRWDVFEGVVTEEEWNEHWWNLREQYQGVRPPTARHSTDFDPGSKYHIPLNSKYISYFLSYQLQFQFHKALCAAAGHQGPLHTCDIYNSRASGDTMRRGLRLGCSRPWPDVLELMTGDRDMSPDALLEYYQPLMQWLQEHNAQQDIHVGW